MRARAARLKAAGICTKCGRRPSLSGRSRCQECLDYMLRWRTENAERFRAMRRRAQYKLRAQALAHYGNRCACCGETEPAFLCIDHINGGGTAQRRQRPGSRIEQVLLREGYPPGYQVLCWNCNAAKSYAGGCPHQR